jgi:hypothetical protein
MRYVIGAALALSLFPAFATAEITPTTAESAALDARFGRGLVCDTPQQVERYLILRNNGKDTTVGLHTVNDEAQNPAACKIALIMFTPGKPAAERFIQGKTVMIVPVTVRAVASGSTWMKISPKVQFTVIVREGANV